MARTFPSLLLSTPGLVVETILFVVVAGIEWKVQIRFCLISRRVPIAEADWSHLFSLGKPH